MEAGGAERGQSPRGGGPHRPAAQLKSGAGMGWGWGPPVGWRCATHQGSGPSNDYVWPPPTHMLCEQQAPWGTSAHPVPASTLPAGHHSRRS